MSRFRFRWISAITLLAVAVGALWTWTLSRPRLKQYVLKESTDSKTPSHSGVKFRYPADFLVLETREHAETVVGLAQIPPSKFEAWMEKHLHIGRSVTSSKTEIVMQYGHLGTESVKDVEGLATGWFPGTITRRIRYPLGPGVVLDGPASNSVALHTLYLFPEPSQRIGAAHSSSAAIMIMYKACSPIEPRTQRIIDDLVSSMKIVPL